MLTICKSAAGDLSRPLEREEVQEALQRVRENDALSEDGIMAGCVAQEWSIRSGGLPFKFCRSCLNAGESGQMLKTWQRSNSYISNS